MLTCANILVEDVLSHAAVWLNGILCYGSSGQDESIIVQASVASQASSYGVLSVLQYLLLLYSQSFIENG